MFWTLYKEWCINIVTTAPDWYWKASSIILIVLTSALVAAIVCIAHRKDSEH